MTDENLDQLGFPGVFTDESKIIPYSPRKQFKFMDTATIKLESMKGMSIDQIVELYKNGYRIEDASSEPKIMTQDVTVSTGSLFLIGLGLVAYLILKK